MNARKPAMRRSRTLEKLRAGSAATCYKLNLSCQRAAEIAAQCGFDCLWVDMEHVPNDLATVEKMVLAGKIHDCDVMVRVPRGSYSSLIWPLEMDASGIMVPHVMSLEDARGIVRSTRFHPVGRRPIDGGNADGAYCAIPITEYIRQANEERFVIVQVEDPEALEDLEEIASLPGIDMLFFGPGDFAHGLGAPGESNHPRLVEARRLVAEAALRHGKFAGTMAAPDKVDEMLGLGYRFLNIGADVIGLRQHCLSVIGKFRPAPAAAPSTPYGDK